MKFENFCGPSYRSQSPIADAERCINWYPEVMESAGAKARVVLYPAPGFTTVASVAQAPSRGLFTHNGRLWWVVGFKLYELSSLFAETDRGSIDIDGNPATWAANGEGGNQLLFSSGGQTYLVDLTTNALTGVLGGVRVTHVGFLDGYFVALDAENSILRASDLFDGTSWPVDQQAQRTAGADPWVAMKILDRQIWLLGSETSEVWWNSGASPMPFEPIQSGFSQFGIAAPFSITRHGNALTWLSQNEQGGGTIVRAQGYLPADVGTHATAFAIQGYDTTADAQAFSYQDQGHEFYVLNFPTAEASWVVDTKTSWWHERLFWDVDHSSWKAYRPQYHAYAFGKHLVADRLTGTVYQMAINLYTDVGGEAQRRMRVAPHLNTDGRMVFYSEFKLDMNVGVGLPTGQGSDPVLALRCSNDGGLTFWNERLAHLGAQGKYLQRVKWGALGASRDRVFEVTASDPVGMRITDASLEASVGIS